MASKSNRRFYLAKYEYDPGRPPCFEDLGSQLTIAGLVVQGMGSTLVLLSPGVDFDLVETTVAKPTLEEWGEIIRQTDNAEIFVGEVGGVNKVLHRKERYSLSGDAQQRVWARDGFQCVFCGAKMGTTLLTVDHWIPLELGGVNDDSNYVTACRRDNKAKGILMPKEFCRIKGYDFGRISSYVAHYIESSGRV